MKKQIHIAQIGVGYWGPNLIRNFAQLDTVGELTVCDLDVSRLNKISEQHPKVNVTQSFDEVLNNTDIDAVVVAIPASLHYEYARKVILAGKHVLVEKPLAMTTQDAEELVNLARNEDKILMVGHTFLYNAAVHKAREYIDNGELGDIYYILAQRLNLGRVRQDVNALWNLAPHDISIILYWLDEIPNRVSAKGLTYLQDGIEDAVFMDLDFPSGRAAHIHVSWLHPSKTRQMIIVGSRKMLIYDDVSTDAKITIYDKGIDKKQIIRDLPDIKSFEQFQVMHRTGNVHIPKINFKEPLRVECQHFVDCLINGETPVTDGQSGLGVVKILDEAQKILDQSRQ